MLSKEEIEKFIKDMTKVRPEMLNEEALKLFNTIMRILDRIDQLERENKILTQTNKTYKGMINKQNSDNKKLIEKLEEDVGNFKKQNADATLQNYSQEILEILRGEE